MMMTVIPLCPLPFPEPLPLNVLLLIASVSWRPVATNLCMDSLTIAADSTSRALVKHQHVWFPHQSSRNGYSLGLAVGYPHSAFSNDGVISIGQAFDELVDPSGNSSEADA